MNTKTETMSVLESDVTVVHPKYLKVMECIKKFIFFGRDGYVLFVVGPSRVGKSRLCAHLMSILIDQIKKGKIRGYGLPIVISATANPNKRSLWISICKSLLIALGDESANEKMSPDVTVERRKQAIKPRGRTTLSLDDLKSLLKERVAYYKPICIFIDEISWVNVCGGHSSDLLSATILHELSSMLDTKIILLGTCGAIDMLNLNEQLALRTERVFFERYRNNSIDIDNFINSAKKVINGSSINIEDNFFDNKKIIYECSLGCLGEFSAWVQRAMSNIDYKNKPILTFRNLLDSMSEYDRLLTAELKIREFESYCDYANQEFSLEKVDQEYMSEVTKQETKFKNTKIKPGKRHPVNDRTGDLFIDQS